MHLSITLVIIIITVLVSLGGFSNQKIINDLIFYPPAITEQKQWYRFFSCGLIHADMGHLLFNMVSLYLFGDFVESSFVTIFDQRGKALYLVMYILALFICLLPTFFKHKNDYYYRSLGASGAVSAVVFTSILFNPTMGIGLIFVPIYISGFIFGILYLAISYWLDKRQKGNINHSAHIWGALFGLAFTIVTSTLLSNYNVLGEFIGKIQHLSPGDLIQFGNN
jgi:membrane associated rhomboid family serine protease